MAASALALLAFAVAGCVSWPVQTLQNLPLPASPARNCCWQALQQLHIRYQQQDYRLTGALAQTATGTTLVLFDPLGRRLLSVQQQGSTQQIWRSPELPDTLSGQFLLASSMLAWWPLADWQAVLPASSPWQLTHTTDERSLSHKGRVLLSARYSAPASSLVDGLSQQTLAHAEVVVLSHHHQPLTIEITTGQLEPLP